VFGLSPKASKYGGILATASLAMVSELEQIAREARALNTVYENCKMVLCYPYHRMRYWSDLYFTTQLMQKTMTLAAILIIDS
jgi:hypothetical protein